ncbi:MAG: NAD-binding protein [Streptosporangiaceae bacterium]|nr:NAD-binding protein [Streptosporangiaceae bacterium]
MPAPAQTGGHFVVCGDDPLAFRLAEELTSRYGEQVTVILPSRRRNEGPRIIALPGVRVIESAELSDQAFADAGVQSARAMALVAQDDLGNFHAALRAQELNAGLRLVLAIFNRRLGDHIRGFFADCTVLSGTAMSAPSFVAAALGAPAPSHVRVSGRTLYVARREDVPAGQVVCSLVMVTSDPAGPTRLLPPVLPPDARPGPGGPDLVLAAADGTPRNPLARRRNPLSAIAAVFRRLTLNVFGLVFIVLLLVIVAGFVLLATGARYSLSNALYLTIMDLTGSALTNPALDGPEKVAQVILTVDGMAFIPVVTALVVGARLTGSVRGAPRPPGGHVIVVGLGNVGTRVVGELHDLGFDVVCVDRDPNARGVPLARRLGLPVVIGEAHLEETLRAASLETSIALVSVTSRDIVNLETALNARALRADLRLVLRLSNDDLATRVQETVGNSVSRSVSYLAAPAFAAALLEHQVLRTIPVGRHVLLIADVRIESGADLAGRPIEDVERDGQTWILALQAGQAARLDWSPHRGYLLAPGDRVVILATRLGLSRFLAGSRLDTARLGRDRLPPRDAASR